MSRRSALRGLGVTLGLPLLEAMTPARAAPAATHPLRLAFLYIPNGAIMDAWHPTGEGRDFTLSPTLAPLAPVKDDILVLSGLDSRNSEGLTGNGHDQACSTWLSSATPRVKDRKGYCTGASVDQIAAAKIGQDTALPSLQLGTANRATRMHTSNISWRSANTPMGKESNPRAVLSRMFGDPKGDVYRRSLLDRALAEARQLRAQLGGNDRAKLDEYFEAIRSVEQRIQNSERRNADRPAPTIQVPDAIPADFATHVKLMTDLMVLAFQADVTRVITFMYGEEGGGGPSFNFLDVRGDHHGLSHYNVNTKEGQQQMAEIRKIDLFHVQQFAYLLERLRSIREGGSTLLDNCMIVLGGGLSRANVHARTDLPLVLAGKGGGILATGRHVRYPKGTPLANLHLFMLDAAGVRLDRFADSTGRLPQDVPHRPVQEPADE
jgi:hypothetical protein